MAERIAYHGSPKPVDRFRSGHRARPDETQQLNFGVHFAVEPEVALIYGRFLHRCRIRWSRLYNASLAAEWSRLPEGHADVIREVVARSSNYPKHLRDWILNQDMVSTGVIERSSNRLVQSVLLAHGFDAVFYEAVITGYRGGSLAKAKTHEAYIIFGDPENQAEVLEILETPKEQWKTFSSSLQ